MNDQFQNKPITIVTEVIPDLIPLFIMYKKSSCISETSMDNWKRLAAVRQSINNSSTDLSCGICKGAMMDDITTFLKVRGFFN